MRFESWQNTSLCYDPVPVSVAEDPLEDNGRDAAVEDLRWQDVEAVYRECAAKNQGKEPVVQMDPVASPGEDY